LNESDTRALLDELIAGRSASAPTADGPIDVVDVLLRLAAGWHGKRADPAQRTDLEALARKVHVARRVGATYKPGWKKDKEAPALGSEHGALLAGVFTAWSTPPAGATEEDLGLARKCLNVACAAAELMPFDDCHPLNAGLSSQLDLVGQETPS
jgi:hypothetical protein